MKNLVAEGVRKDIRDRIADVSFGSQAIIDAENAYGKIREDCLVSWLSSESPLAYGRNGGDETYKLLLRAVASTEQLIVEGLPNWHNNSMSPSTFVDNLFDMSKPVRPTQPKAPVIQTGSFLPVLKMAHMAIIALFDDDDDPAITEKYLKNILREALKIFHVHFFPCHLPNTGTRGSPNRKPVWNSWTCLGGRDHLQQVPLDDLTSYSAPSGSSSTRNRVLPETIAVKKALANDCNADWSSEHLTLSTLKEVLNKTSLPIDFTTPSSDEPYVQETYDWVRANYDGNNTVHHLALIVSIIVATSFLPHIFISKASKNLFKNAKTPAQVRSIYNMLAWEKRDGKKGVTNKKIFIGMITSFIIAIYEEQSPLRTYMASTSHQGLGDAWTSKNSTSLRRLLTLPIMANPFSSLP